MAEHLVYREREALPVGIVRPSIVLPAAEEPLPGWVDNVNGMAGLGVLASVGILRNIDWNYWAVSDMVPVDFCANAIIVAGHSIAMKHEKRQQQQQERLAKQEEKLAPPEVPVYNLTSGNIKPISWGRFFHMLRDEAVARPPTKVIRPIILPPKHRRANFIMFNMTRIFSELLFAYFIDLVLLLIGYKTFMVRITRRMHHGYEILKPFTTQDWTFNSDNVLAMIDSMSDSDRQRFNFDMRRLDWNVQAQRVYHGARYYILKQEDSAKSYRDGRRRLKLVTFIHYFGLLLISCALLYASVVATRKILHAF